MRQEDRCHGLQEFGSETISEKDFQHNILVVSHFVYILKFLIALKQTIRYLRLL